MSEESLPQYELDLSVLFITYNRSDLLSRSFWAIKAAIEQCGLRVEYIVSDDASAPEHQDAIAALPFDKFLVAPRNQGLGANTNRAISAAAYGYILQIQDDWEFFGAAATLKLCVEILRRDPDIGILQLTHVHSDLPAEVRRLGSATYSVFKNDGLPWRRSAGIRPYSDCPHIKRREFCDDVGPYRDAVTMGVCENDYKRRVATQRKWKVARLDGPPLFRHLGKDSSLNSPGPRHPVVAFLQDVPLVGISVERLVRRVTAAADHFSARLWSKLFSQ